VIAMLSVGPLAGAAAGAGAGQAAGNPTVAAVTRELAGESELRGLKVSVDGSEVTLTGRVPTLWHKMDAVKRALKADGVKTVRPEIELPRQESDQDLALFLGPAIDRYPYYTMFDYIDANIRNGVVTLFGSVTGERKKAEEIVEEVSRVRGVQEIRNQLETLPASIGDDRIRASLLDRLADSSDFDRFLNMRNPPFHIVVRNGTITLFGRVQSEIEFRQLESLARFTPGVLRVENKLQTITKSNR
jgi:osmotically-inducible protein OsmY